MVVGNSTWKLALGVCIGKAAHRRRTRPEDAGTRPPQPHADQRAQVPGALYSIRSLSLALTPSGLPVDLRVLEKTAEGRGARARKDGEKERTRRET
jgi:hypothetical protein